MRYISPETLCIEGREYIRTENNPNGLVPKTTYDNQVNRNQIKVHGRGGNGNGILIEFESLPEPYKKLVQEKLCGGMDVYEYAALQPIRELIRPDVQAINFFQRYELSNGKLLSDVLQREYCKAASIMRMLDKVYEDKRWLKKELKVKLTKFLELVGNLKETKEAGLPSSERKLRDRYEAWKKEGYAGLISKKVGNTNRQKVTAELVNLILSLYTQQEKPYATDVLDAYNAFMRGEKHLVDIEGGEVFDPINFMDGDKPIEISSTTIWNIIQQNKVIVDKMRLSRLEYNNRHRPYNSRISPIYAFSKITMDDRSIPFKMEDGKRAWAYFIADVASQCIVGRSFARSNDEGSGKDRKLFMGSMMDMFRLIVNNEWGMPAEIEVEHHISNTFVGKTDANGTFTPDLLTNGHLFPFVTFCNPSNPQQKRAEHIIKQFKYQLEKNIPGFQGRPFARQDANRLNQDKPGPRYPFEEVVANVEELIRIWNNQEHPDQKKYPGLTRWQVLENNRNPQLVQPHLPVIAKHIGVKQTTSVRRTECKAFNSTYVIPAAKADLNSTIVTAFGVPDTDGKIANIYLYQDDEYVCTASEKGAYNEAKIERTEDDERIRQEQSKHTAQFDALVKGRVKELKKIAVIKNSSINTEVAAAPVTVVNISEGRDPLSELIEEDQHDDDYWTRKAINDL